MRFRPTILILDSLNDAAMPAGKVHFFKENIRFRFPDQEGTSRWLLRAIRSEGFTPGEINVIFCNDEMLLDMNRQFLQHDYLTDIITFDHSEDPAVVQGELYISIDRVKDNAASFEVTFLHELHRVLIHGVLHLCGYSDKSPRKKKEMTAAEDHYLKRRVTLR